ncbi:MAG: MBL fold metallo-hydrolase [Armatimonadetes bacterium]|nr:MBL fold metallo-hydrolase [Armatimonadota bacterium]
MILKRFYDDALAQASFLVGCDGSHEAIVIDPNRDIQQYIQAAEDAHLRIVAVTETHIHADYISGSRELAQKVGAKVYLSDEGDADWKYGYASEPNVVLVKDGDHIRAGSVRLDVMKTAGHTPEHISFLLTDEKASPTPMAAFTGDFIFIGDCGRPDLLERAAGFKGTMEAGAKVLFNSLSKFKSFPDSLMLWPSHGAGSACGKNLSALPVSTLGYEKGSNWALKAGTESEFVNEVLAGQPEPPVYFKMMKYLNKMGPPILGGFATPKHLEDKAILDLLKEGKMIIDIRPSEEVVKGFIPGVIHIPLVGSFTTWAGWFCSYDEPLYFLSPDEESAKQAVKRLAMIGLDKVGGWFGPGAIAAFTASGGQLENMKQIDAATAAAKFKSKEVEIVDVRGAGEYSEAHIPGARNIHLGTLPSRHKELSEDRPLVVHCQGGVRSLTGMTVLRKLGHKNLINMTDGFWEYNQLGLPVATGAEAQSPANV